MVKKKVIEPLEMVRNIVEQFDIEIKGAKQALKLIESYKETEVSKEMLYGDYKDFVRTLETLREYVIYKA
jgi:hypothetical protein